MLTNDSGGSCAVFPHHPEHCSVMTYTKNVASAMSIVGSMLVLMLIWLLRKYKAFTQRLIVHVSIASLGHPAAYSMYDASDAKSTMCVVQAVLVTFFDDAISFWVSVVAINLYSSVFHNTNLQNYEKRIATACWTLPAILALLPLVKGRALFEPVHVWCWVSNVWTWRLVSVYCWRVLSVAVMLVLICRIVYRLFVYSRSQRGGTIGRDFDDDIRTLRLYPIVYLLMIVISVVNRVQNALSPDEPVFALYVIQSITDPSFGFVVAMVFVLDKKTRQAIGFRKMRDLIRQRGVVKHEAQSYNVGEIQSIEASD